MIQIDFANLPILKSPFAHSVQQKLTHCHRLMNIPNFQPMETTIAEVQSAMTAGVLTSEQLTAWYLERIDAYDQLGPALNAIAAINEQALDDARQLDAERTTQGARGPLHGVPVLLKDNYETAGLQTAAGSILLRDWQPPSDGYLVRRLKEAGAVVLAKTNMHEFAFSITNQGSLFGDTRNPYSLERNPGGSSGGTGAGIAANFGLLGWGSDTCGSIRIPAAHNNLVGIRCTQGLLSRSGIIPLSSTQDIGGPLARSVADVAVALDATVGYDPDDPTTALSLGRLPQSYADSLNPEGLKNVRLGLLQELLFVDESDAEVAQVIGSSQPALEQAGATVVDVSMPQLAELLVDRVGGFLIIRNDFKFDINSYLEARPTAPVRSLDEILASGKIHPSIGPKIQLSNTFDLRDTPEYREHLLKRMKLKIAICQTMAENQLDALIYPTIRHTAAPIGEEQLGTNCKLSANSGLPAISVPAGFTDEGMPVGLEFLSTEWSEPKLIAMAYAFEQATRYRRAPGCVPAL